MDEIKVIKKGSGRFIVFHESDYGMTEQRFKNRESALYYYNNLTVQDKFFFKEKLYFNSVMKVVLLVGTVLILSVIIFKLIEYFDIATLSDSIELSYEEY